MRRRILIALLPVIRAVAQPLDQYPSPYCRCSVWERRDQVVSGSATTRYSCYYSSFQLSEHISNAKDAKERKDQLIVLKICVPSLPLRGAILFIQAKYAVRRNFQLPEDASLIEDPQRACLG